VIAVCPWEHFAGFDEWIIIPRRGIQDENAAQLPSRLAPSWLAVLDLTQVGSDELNGHPCPENPRAAMNQVRGRQFAQSAANQLKILMTQWWIKVIWNWYMADLEPLLSITGQEIQAVGGAEFPDFNL